MPVATFPTAGDTSNDMLTRMLRRSLILTHRYFGIAPSLLVAVWFASGIVMMYAGGMPRLTPELRLERLPPFDMFRIFFHGP